MNRKRLYRVFGSLAVMVSLIATIFATDGKAVTHKPTDFIWISAGDYHTCAARFDGTTWCWGANDQGQLGNGSVGTTCPSGKTCMHKPQQVKNFAFGQIDAGGDTTCALASGGAAFCWGDNTYGQVGTNFMGLTSFSTPQAVSGGRTFSRISSGSTSTCGLSAVKTTTGLFCWGLLVTGNTSTTTPTLVRLSSAFSDVSVGNGHVCAASANALANEIDCSGLDNYGQLGVDPTSLGTTVLGPFSTTLSSLLFSSLGNYAYRVSAGGSAFGYSGGHAYTCADQASGVVQCVGNNEYGQLGLGYKSFGVTLPNGGVTYLPQTVGNSQPLTGVTTGMSHACALDLYTSYAWCWGQDAYGELGNGYFGGSWIYGPQMVSTTAPSNPTGLPVRALAAGMSHTCAIGADNHVYCWGDNSSGQLGVSTSSVSKTSYPQIVVF